MSPPCPHCGRTSTQAPRELAHVSRTCCLSTPDDIYRTVNVVIDRAVSEVTREGLSWLVFAAAGLAVLMFTSWVIPAVHRHEVGGFVVLAAAVWVAVRARRAFLRLYLAMGR